MPSKALETIEETPDAGQGGKEGGFLIQASQGLHQAEEALRLADLNFSNLQEGHTERAFHLAENAGYSDQAWAEWIATIAAPVDITTETPPPPPKAPPLHLRPAGHGADLSPGPPPADTVNTVDAPASADYRVLQAARTAAAASTAPPAAAQGSVQDGEDPSGWVVYAEESVYSGCFTCGGPHFARDGLCSVDKGFGKGKGNGKGDKGKAPDKGKGGKDPKGGKSLWTVPQGGEWWEPDPAMTCKCWLPALAALTRLT